MRNFIVMLLVFIFAVYLGLHIAEDPGYAFFSYKAWSVEMPLWFAAVLQIAFFLVVYWAARIVDSLDFSVYRWHNWLRWRRKNRAYSKTNHGLLALAQGDWQKAETCLVEGLAQSDEPLVNYLSAAKAAQQRQAYEKRDHYIQKAYHVAPNEKVVIGLTQAQLLFEQQCYEQALAVLQQIKPLAPKNKILLKLLERLYVHLGDWQKLLLLVPTLRSVKLINREEAEASENRIYSEVLKTYAKKEIHSLREAWNSFPARIKKNAVVRVAYAELLFSHPDTADEIEKSLSGVIKEHWNPEALRLYGLLDMPHPAKALTKAEAWLRLYPDQPLLYLTLGRICVRCQLWGKAKSNFEMSLRLHPSRDVYVEYGKLLEKLGESSLALQNYRQGLVCGVMPAGLFP